MKNLLAQELLRVCGDWRAAIAAGDPPHVLEALGNRLAELSLWTLIGNSR